MGGTAYDGGQDIWIDNIWFGTGARTRSEREGQYLPDLFFCIYSLNFLCFAFSNSFINSPCFIYDLTAYARKIRPAASPKRVREAQVTKTGNEYEIKLQPAVNCMNNYPMIGEYCSTDYKPGGG